MGVSLERRAKQDGIMSSAIRFLLNGTPMTVENPDPATTLLDWLRGDAHLTATKEGCREGDCGACTVVMGFPRDGRLELRAVNACLILLPMADGRLIVTAEGLEEGGALHAVQAALVENHGSQCGFCTPGMAMSLMAFQHAREPAENIHEALGGNLCRCTGYRPIADAAQHICAHEPNDRYAREAASLAAALEALERTDTLAVEKDGRRFFAPRSLAALTKLAEAHKGARFVAGGTDLGLLITKQYQELATIVAVDRVAGLCGIEETEEGVTLGAAVTYADAIPAFDRLAPALGKLVRRIGSRQIRALGTIAGNIANASPIGDIIPPLLALGAEVRLASVRGERSLPLGDFLTGYRKTAAEPGEVIAAVHVPRPPPGAALYCYKVAKRHEQDISTVSASFLLTAKGGTVAGLRAAYGGMAATVRRAPAIEAALVGQPWGEAAVSAAQAAVAIDFAPMSDVRGSAGYRRTVAGNLLTRLFLESTNPALPLEVMAL
jgi:xanthine dehydrogenase small subunit